MTKRLVMGILAAALFFSTGSRALAMYTYLVKVECWGDCHNAKFRDICPGNYKVTSVSCSQTADPVGNTFTCGDGTFTCEDVYLDYTYGDLGDICKDTYGWDAVVTCEY
jgi:hypothetical protein